MAAKSLKRSDLRRLRLSANTDRPVILANIVAHDLFPPEVSQRLLQPVVGSDPVLRIIFSGEAAHAPVVATLVQRLG